MKNRPTGVQNNFSKNTDLGSARPLEISQVRLLVTLLTQRSVSSTADVLGQSQPQVSASLARIRTLLGDPIVVRTSTGMVPTEAALRMLAPAQRILQDMHELQANNAPFVAQELDTTLRIASPDLFGSELLAAIIGEIRRAAPRASIAVQPFRGRAEALTLLESGQADLLLESNLVRSQSLRHSSLFSEGFLCVAAAGHSCIHDALSLEEYLNLPHVAAAPSAGTHPGVVDRLLADRGHTRRVVARLPYLNALPAILERSDLVLTTSEHMARQFGRSASLQVFRPPLKLPQLRHYLMWHERVHRSAAHRWLRGLISAAARAQVASGIGLPLYSGYVNV